MNMHELGMNRAWTEYEVTMIVGIKSMKYGTKFPNFMGVARENLLCFEHEQGHVHAQEPWTIFPWSQTLLREYQNFIQALELQVRNSKWGVHSA